MSLDSSSLEPAKRCGIVLLNSVASQIHVGKVVLAQRKGQRANWLIVNTSSPSNVYDFVGISYAWPRGQKIESTSCEAWDAGL
jgi:hypothetical protein